MAESHDFFTAGDPDQARRIVHDALVREGFSVTEGERRSLLATRGKLGLTLVLGGLANDRTFHTSMAVEFMVTPDGQTVARLLRGATGSALKGGALGYSRGNRAFEQVANAIHADLARAGILTNSVSNA